MVKKIFYSILETALGFTSEQMGVNLGMKLIDRRLKNTDSVESYKLRRRMYDRFFKSYPILYSHEAQRVFGFFNLLGQLKEVEGDVVECGVGRGRFFTIFVYANQHFGLNKKLYGFDSFEGFPVAHEKDFGTRVLKKEKITGWDDVQPEMIYHILDADIDTEGSESLFKKDQPEVKLIKGFFCDTLEDNLPEKISFLHLDADLYESTYDALKECLPKMSKGGLIVFDELHEKEKWPGVQKAVEELCTPLNLSTVWLKEVQRYGIWM